jgi:tetratricopeptide (TPR) repeat protein
MKPRTSFTPITYGLLITLLYTSCSPQPPPPDSPTVPCTPAHETVQVIQGYIQTNDFDTAITHLTAELTCQPADPALLSLRGEMYTYQYEWDLALQDYQAAIESDPTYADAYYLRGLLYYTRLEYPLAIANFEQYLLLAPDDIHTTTAIAYVEEIRLLQATLDR